MHQRYGGYSWTRVSILTSSKISPPRIRGTLLGGVAFTIVVMQTIGLAVVRSFVSDIRPSAFRTVFALQWLVGGFPIIPFLLVPE
jgi:hypothetical protein